MGNICILIPYEIIYSIYLTGLLIRDCTRHWRLCNYCDRNPHTDIMCPSSARDFLSGGHYSNAKYCWLSTNLCSKLNDQKLPCRQVEYFNCARQTGWVLNCARQTRWVINCVRQASWVLHCSKRWPSVGRPKFCKLPCRIFELAVQHGLDLRSKFKYNFRCNRWSSPNTRVSTSGPYNKLQCLHLPYP